MSFITILVSSTKLLYFEIHFVGFPVTVDRLKLFFASLTYSDVHPFPPATLVDTFLRGVY